MLIHVSNSVKERAHDAANPSGRFSSVAPLIIAMTSSRVAVAATG